MFFVYMLKSKTSDEIYIGSTKNLKRRIKEHNEGKHFSTRRYLPWVVIYIEGYIQEKLARMREKRLKYHGNALRELKKRIGLIDFKSGAGFTLLEFLVVIGLLSITIGSILLFLTAVLKGTNQANITSEVKQNGQVVLDTLESQIRNATDAVCLNQSNNNLCSDPTASTTHIKLLRTNSNPLHVRCVASVSTTQNGKVEIAAADNPADADYRSITSTDIVSGVDITNCAFTITPTSGGVSAPPIVAVNFAVSQGVDATSRSDFLANVSFQTTISLRGY